ncbi:MAG: glycosyltransferase family 9 protein [Victivallales bacterium]|nr:glycosyltransferase family 9 protein [Victivallales bacterium]
MRVLIVKPSSIGDVLHTFPAVALLRRAVPEVAALDWVVNDSLMDVVRLCGDVDRIIPFPRKTAWRPSALFHFMHELRAERYDVVLDFQGLLRSGLITYFSHANVRAGFACAREGASWFYNQKVALPEMHAHAADKNLTLVREVFHLPDDLPTPTAKIHIPANGNAEADRLAERLPGKGPLLAVCFSSRWPSKNWPLPFLAQILELVTAAIPDVRIWLLGAQNDVSDGDRLATLAPHARPVNLAGKTSFGGLAALLARSRALMTVDSGPMHLAAALGTRCFALFGATDPVLTGPYGPAHVVFRSPCPDSPCLERNCPRHADCTANLAPDTIATSILPFLQTQGTVQ